VIPEFKSHAHFEQFLVAVESNVVIGPYILRLNCEFADHWREISSVVTMLPRCLVFATQGEGIRPALPRITLLQQEALGYLHIHCSQMHEWDILSSIIPIWSRLESLRISGYGPDFSAVYDGEFNGHLLPSLRSLAFYRITHRLHLPMLRPNSLHTLVLEGSVVDYTRLSDFISAQSSSLRRIALEVVELHCLTELHLEIS
jgi:hypothetical protein